MTPADIAVRFAADLERVSATQRVKLKCKITSPDGGKTFVVSATQNNHACVEFGFDGKAWTLHGMPKICTVEALLLVLSEYTCRAGDEVTP